MPAAWNESVAATAIWIVFHIANAALLWWLLADKEINTFEDEDSE